MELLERIYVTLVEFEVFMVMCCWGYIFKVFLPFVWKSKVFHVNYKILLTVLGMQFNVVASFRLVYLFVYLKVHNGILEYDESIDVGTGFPMFLKIMHVGGLDMVVLTSVVLAMERFAATYYADKNYNAQNAKLGILLLIFDFVAGNAHGVFLALYQYYSDIPKECRIRPLMEADHNEFWFGFFKGWSACIGGCVTFGVIYVWGQKRRHNYNFSLDVKFQISNNMTTVRTLYIVVFGYFICVTLGMLYFLAWTPYLNTRKCTDPDFQIVVWTGHLWMALYYYSYIWGIVYYSNKPPKPSKKVKPKYEADYFQTMNSGWDMPTQEKKGFSIKDLPGEIKKFLAEIM
ncbi:unnamed protein product [Bursaphelenchus okinawaensis]|uniref:Uncharacterized protein n=1 Tax=Bursaphelenchus okinawaensis TaxID=465554 RepID=A0A811L0R6_9BILA|nr:unnamed protein product [Bursaphelenchus okinawaensis]CAG9115324.1 unnamed protein product [Bursaphelenchus okinawaensis]